jgi:hypothetical protein
MIEIYGNIFDFDGDAICLTTNGQTRRDGAAVMGRGVAKQATELWPGIEYRVGEVLNAHGNHTSLITTWNQDWDSPKIPLIGLPKSRAVAPSEWPRVPFHIFILPVKRHWRDKADLQLIENSLLTLAYLVKNHKAAGPATAKRDRLRRVALPRPGCGNGGLKWGDVQPLVHTMLPGKEFIVIERSP